MGGGVSGMVAAERKFMLNGNAVSEFARLPLESWSQFRYVMAAPLDFSGLRGTLSLYRSGDQKFTPEDGRILAALAPKIAMAVANGLKFQKDHEPGRHRLAHRASQCERVVRPNGSGSASRGPDLRFGRIQIRERQVRARHGKSSAGSPGGGLQEDPAESAILSRAWVAMSSCCC